MNAITTGSCSGQCQTIHPIVLLHGIGYRDDWSLFASWGRVPDALRAEGAQVFLGGADAWNTHENSAAELKPHIEAILQQSGAEKVNLIAHSKGGLEARYLISKLGMANRVASLTTVCTPHRGTLVADLVVGAIPDSQRLLRFNFLKYAARLLGFLPLDFLARLTGDKSPQAVQAISQLTRAYLENFNESVPNDPGVYYQSYGTTMKSPADDPVFAATYSLLRLEEQGENDGMVPVESCKWGNFRGLIARDDPHKGLSHADMVDYRRGLMTGIDIPGIYVGIVKELKNMGF